MPMLEAWLRAVAFRDVRVEASVSHPELRLGDAVKMARDRSSSQLELVTSAEYVRGLRQLEKELAARGPDALIPEEICLVTVVASA